MALANPTAPNRDVPGESYNPRGPNVPDAVVRATPYRSPCEDLPDDEAPPGLTLVPKLPFRCANTCPVYRGVSIVPRAAPKRSLSAGGSVIATHALLEDQEAPKKNNRRKSPPHITVTTQR